jgi:hypothetical protein
MSAQPLWREIGVICDRHKAIVGISYLERTSLVARFSVGPIVAVRAPGGPFGQSISNGFIASSSGTGTEVFFAKWVLAGTVPTGVSWAIGTQNFGGTIKRVGLN